MTSPYSNLPPESFWRTGVAAEHWGTLQNLYRKKFEITRRDKVATAGSCFAQHIARHMRQRGYQVPDYEPAPKLMSDELARKYGYGVYSARYANIYVVRHLLQLLHEAWGKGIAEERVWQKDGRFYDAMRPSVEPVGFSSADEVLALRDYHLASVRRMVRDMNVFVFTFGLTESWIHKVTGKVFPTCPGTVAGQFDPAIYAFKNFTFGEILKDFLACRKFIKRRNSSARFLVTVSPVPLVATASKQHVLAATMYSKSVLRAVAGHLADRHDDIDYFPSYEVIASPWSGGFFYEQNRREVTPLGVETVMRIFFSEHKSVAGRKSAERKAGAEEVDPVCEEVLLEAFGR